jgi:hypothetical protein
MLPVLLAFTSKRACVLLTSDTVDFFFPVVGHDVKFAT